MLEKFAIALMITAYAFAGLSTVSGFGYFLYLWGSQGEAMNVSAWAGFVVFLQLAGTAVGIAIVGWVFTKVVE